LESEEIARQAGGSEGLKDGYRVPGWGGIFTIMRYIHNVSRQHNEERYLEIYSYILCFKTFIYNGAGKEMRGSLGH